MKKIIISFLFFLLLYPESVEAKDFVNFKTDPTGIRFFYKLDSLELNPFLDPKDETSLFIIYDNFTILFYASKLDANIYETKLSSYFHYENEATEDNPIINELILKEIIRTQLVDPDIEIQPKKESDNVFFYITCKTDYIGRNFENNIKRLVNSMKRAGGKGNQ